MATSRPAWMMHAMSCGTEALTPRPGSGHEPRERKAPIRMTRSHNPGRCRRVEPPRNHASLPRPAFPETLTTFPRPRMNRNLRPVPSLSSRRVSSPGGLRRSMIPTAPHPRTTSSRGNQWRPRPILSHPGGEATRARVDEPVSVWLKPWSSMLCQVVPSRRSEPRQVAMEPTVMIRSRRNDRESGVKVSRHDCDHRLWNGQSSERAEGRRGRGAQPK